MLRKSLLAGFPVAGLPALSLLVCVDIPESTDFDSSEVSVRGVTAQFRDAVSEVTRIMKVQNNYYSVLKLNPTSEGTAVESNYIRLNRLVNPETCDDALVDAASDIIKKAYLTLANHWRRSMYDQYLLESPVNVTFDIWLAQTGNISPPTPSWVKHLLDCPCGAVLGLTIFFPLTIVFAILHFVKIILLLPFKLCCGDEIDEVKESNSESVEAEERQYYGSVELNPRVLSAPVVLREIHRNDENSAVEVIQEVRSG